MKCIYVKSYILFYTKSTVYRVKQKFIKICGIKILLVGYTSYYLINDKFHVNMNTRENHSTFYVYIHWTKMYISYVSQAVAGSIMKPRETPQRPGRRATAVALGLYIVMNLIMQSHVDLLFSIESAATLYMFVTPSQHGVPSAGSGSPYSTKFEQPDIRDNTVVQSTDAVTASMQHTISSKIVMVAVLWDVLRSVTTIFNLIRVSFSFFNEEELFWFVGC